MVGAAPEPGAQARRTGPAAGRQLWALYPIQHGDGPADAPGVVLYEQSDPGAPDAAVRLAVRWAVEDLPGLLASVAALEAGLLARARRRDPLREVELTLAAPAELHDDAANLLLALYRSEAPRLQGARTTLALREARDAEPVHRIDLSSYGWGPA